MTSGIVADMNGNITGYGKGAEKIFGYTQKEVLGKPVSLFHPQRHQDVLARVFQDTVEKGEFSDDVVLVRKNGKEFRAHLTVRPLKDAQGNVTGLVGTTEELK